MGRDALLHAHRRLLPRRLRDAPVPRRHAPRAALLGSIKRSSWFPSTSGSRIGTLSSAGELLLTQSGLHRCSGDERRERAHHPLRAYAFTSHDRSAVNKRTKIISF